MSPMTVLNPTLRLAHDLRRVFLSQAREVRAALRPNVLDGAPPPDVTHWAEATAAVSRPLFLHQWRHGMLRCAARLSQQLPGRVFVGKMTHGLVIVKGRGEVIHFDLTHPRVLDAVDAAVMQFCRETNETATLELKQAVKDLRKLLKRGLERGEAMTLLHKKVLKIFADPTRSWRIANTEVSRAQNLGQLTAARDSGAVGGKRWGASAGACPVCEELDGKEVELDEPFVVLKGGGPYAVVYHPPLHPFLRVPVG